MDYLTNVTEWRQEPADDLMDNVTNVIDGTFILYVTSTGADIHIGYFMVCMLTLVLAGWIVALNIIVVYTLTWHKVYSEVTDYFVASLSIADLFTGFILFYITAYSLTQYQNFWECLFRFGLTYVVSQSSYIHLLAITIDRYVKIIYPFYYMKMFTKKTVVCISSTIWVISFIIGLLPLFGWRHQGTGTDTVCRFFGVLTNSYFIFNLILSAVILSVTVFLHGKIIYVARRKHNENLAQVPAHVRKSKMSGIDKHAWRLVKTIGLVVIVSNLCWLPGVALLLLHISGMLDHVSVETKGDFITYSGLAVFLNSLINPLIYAAKIKVVNKRFRKIFCCCCKGQGVYHPVSSQRETTEL